MNYDYTLPPITEAPLWAAENSSQPGHRRTTSRPSTGGKALRRSCDRCHAQKLKCSGSKDFLAKCERCARAGLDCVYSTRASKKTAPSLQDGDNQGMRTPDSTGMAPLLDGTENELQFSDVDFHGLLSSAGNHYGFTTPDSYHSSQQSPRNSSIMLHGFETPPLHDSSGYSNLAHALVETPAGGLPAGQLDDALEQLPAIAYRLKNISRKVAVVCSGQDIHKYPIGEVFTIFKQLSGVLEQDSSLRQSPQEQSVDDSFRQKSALIAAQCYVSGVRIIVSLSTRWLHHLNSLTRMSYTSPERPFTAEPVYPPLQEGRHGRSSDNLGTLRRDLDFDGLYSHLDPIGYSLNCASLTISTSIKLLVEIEDLLGVQPKKGVRATPNYADAKRYGNSAL
ncbi:uncharacterized protein K460DRAFT_403578 [Cucurbitaria berberidis CBS 394.84]|uniref:Zn(2)-C6 fungal-type domain-containing protein n=1 Tax=Cucurbitaria berberidis CBS 394.84 TaxID=1168544 RepID=A0A9P4LAE0_9PLEO|nr:uncharacterized protein K460DRAFT_403578 [Cucurbitaria berberidis CBS 394.84]KAF1848286.1 hypothetical protein K460DRAFT_403578 [Cucurbitaria berberidis CBS 394.84]